MSSSTASEPGAGLTAELASKFARIALGHVTREYPNIIQHVLADAGDARTPRDLHPIFFGSFDWHSCVHGYWLLARLSAAHPEIDETKAIHALFDEMLTPANVAGELHYLQPPGRRGFERPYGWAWLLKLQAELHVHPHHRWAAALRPLAEAFADRFLAYLPLAHYPVRAGVHSNTAFALRLAADYAQTCGDNALLSLLKDKALAWYGADKACQAWEPSGDDFLSSALIEAEAVRRLHPEGFREWFARFLPQTAERAPATLFTPATVTDRTDGKIAHLDGVNFSRAWCWRAIARDLPEGAARTVALAAAEAHLQSALPHVAGDYMGEHWLASFALLALEA